MSKIEITANAIKEAYEKTGKKPVVKNWYNEEANCCCALTALTLCQIPEDEFKHRRGDCGSEHVVKKVLGLDNEELWAFVYGFDGYDFEDVKPEIPDTESMRKLHGIGAEARDLIFYKKLQD